MKPVIKLFNDYWNLCCLKESPENTVYSLRLLVIITLLFSMIMYFQWSMSKFSVASDLITFCIALNLALSFIIYSSVILYLKGLKERLVQTATSLLSAHSIIHLLAMPLFLIDPLLTQSDLKNPLYMVFGVLYLLVTLALSIWQVVITAHIYKHALNTTPAQSLLAAFGLIAVNILTLALWR